MNFKQRGWEGMGWVSLAQDREKWQTVLNTVTIIWVEQNGGKFSTT
jgi:hypothetical protein